jgi:zinc D-Ala-D-Ala carboxypeptidase
MSVPRRSRLLAGGGVAAAALAAGAVIAPQAASAPRTAPPPAAPRVSKALALASTSARAAASQAGTTAAVAPAAPQAAAGKPGTRLTLTVRRGRTTLAVVGVLARVSTGEAIGKRSIGVYQRRADTGRWARVRTLHTSTRGRIEHDLRDRPLQQFTLRFSGDRRFGPAASQTIVPEPTGARALNPSLVKAVSRARAAAARAGLSLVINSGYRTWAKQQQMYDSAVRRYGSARAARRWVLPPQESTHVRGLAVDIGTPAAAAWLATRGGAFGLCRAYADEPWHFEYRPDWIVASGGRCPRPVTAPGDPDPLSPAPRLHVL